MSWKKIRHLIILWTHKNTNIDFYVLIAWGFVYKKISIKYPRPNDDNTGGPDFVRDCGVSPAIHARHAMPNFYGSNLELPIWWYQLDAVYYATTSWAGRKNDSAILQPLKTHLETHKLEVLLHPLHSLAFDGTGRDWSAFRFWWRWQKMVRFMDSLIKDMSFFSTLNSNIARKMGKSSD